MHRIACMTVVLTTRWLSTFYRLHVQHGHSTRSRWILPVLGMSSVGSCCIHVPHFLPGGALPRVESPWSDCSLLVRCRLRFHQLRLGQSTIRLSSIQWQLQNLGQETQPYRGRIHHHQRRYQEEFVVARWMVEDFSTFSLHARDFGQSLLESSGLEHGPGGTLLLCHLPDRVVDGSSLSR